MAPVKSMNGTKLLIQIGDGEDPEVFAHDCLINTERSFSVEKSTNSFAVIDCDNPDDAAWVERVSDELSAAISGSGVLHTTSLKTWFGYVTSGESYNARILLNGVAAIDGGGHFAGKFKVTNLEITGNRGEKTTVSVALENDGAVTWVDAT